MSKATYVPKVGDVILYNNESVVVIKFENYEDSWSYAYDRKYYYISKIQLDKLLEDNKIIDAEDLIKKCKCINIRGTEFPTIIKLDDEAPYELNEKKYYLVRRKTRKSIVIYE